MRPVILQETSRYKWGCFRNSPTTTLQPFAAWLVCQTLVLGCCVCSFRFVEMIFLSVLKSHNSSSELHQLTSPRTAYSFLDSLLTTSSTLKSSLDEVGLYSSYIIKSWRAMFKSSGIFWRIPLLYITIYNSNSLILWVMPLLSFMCHKVFSWPETSTHTWHRHPSHWKPIHHPTSSPTTPSFSRYPCGTHSRFSGLRQAMNVFVVYRNSAQALNSCNETKWRFH